MTEYMLQMRYFDCERSLFSSQTCKATTMSTSTIKPNAPTESATGPHHGGTRSLSNGARVATVVVVLVVSILTAIGIFFYFRRRGQARALLVSDVDRAQGAVQPPPDEGQQIAGQAIETEPKQEDDPLRGTIINVADVTTGITPIWPAQKTLNLATNITAPASHPNSEDGHSIRHEIPAERDPTELENRESARSHIPNNNNSTPDRHRRASELEALPNTFPPAPVVDSMTDGELKARLAALEEEEQGLKRLNDIKAEKRELMKLLNRQSRQSREGSNA